jgi:5-methylcytosine-specific restriction endonuclease McrA
MKKLSKRNTYTPIDASQVSGNCDRLLNREETLSVSGSKTLDNRSEVNQSEHKKQDLRVPVYVLNMRGQPLMPTKPAKAKHLLKLGKAKVVKRTPFTIQLKYATGETKQEIILGIDSAFKTIGYSARTRTAELISGEVILRTDIPDKLEEKKMYRRGRRSRNTQYREVRFLNRNIPNSWFAPSIEHKIKSHLELIKKIKKLLPITEIEIEVSTFDTQKMQNPEIAGIEYQRGELQGYEVREYLLDKFQRKCAYCGKTDIPLEIEHVIPSSKGGSDRVSNLTIACHKCNQKKGNKTAIEFGHPEIEALCKKSLKASAFMNTVRWELVKRLKDQYRQNTVNYTYGYITKKLRIDLGLEKSHVNDAFVISKGTDQGRCRPHAVKQNRRNNRSLQLNRKGFKPSIRTERYKFQPNDLVRYKEQAYPVKGVFNYGAWIRLRNENGEDINSNIKNVELITYGKGLQFGF